MATTKCLLYCTKAIKHYSVGHLIFNLDDLTLNPDTNKYVFGDSCYLMASKNSYGKDNFLNGKIVAECEVETEEIKIFDKVNWKNEWENKLEESCLTINQLENYLYSNNYKGYALHIKNLKIFDRLKELKDYCVDNSKYYKEYGWCLTCEEKYTPIQKAPQNMMWCFDRRGNRYALISIRPEWLCKILNEEKTIEIRKKVLKGMCDDE